MLDPIAELGQHRRRHVGRRLGHEVDADALGADQPGGPLDLVHQRLRGVVEQQVGLVEEEAQLGLGQVAGLGQRLVQLRQHPEHERGEQPGLVHDVGSSRMLMIPVPSGVVRSRSATSNSGSPKKTSAPSCSRTTIERRSTPDGRARHAAVVGQDRLALVGRRGYLSVALRSLRSSSGRSLSSQYLKTRARIDVCVSLRSRTLPSSSGPNEWTVARTWAPSLPDRDRNSTGWPDGLERPAERGDALDDLRVGRVAGRGESGQVALDVGHEDRHAGLGELARQELQGLGLARARGAGDEAVPVEHRQRDLDPGVVGQLVAEHRAADDQARLGQRVAGGHRVVERLVHRSSGRRSGGRGGVGKRIIGRPWASASGAHSGGFRG